VGKSIRVALVNDYMIVLEGLRAPEVQRTAAARGERVVSTQRTQHAQIDDAVRWPGREIGLTERESELLSLLSTGMTNRELGTHLYISENTVKTQQRHLYAKLGVRNRAQAASVGGRHILGDHRPQAKPAN
jgi:DNA-binding CsgD family transcriptional regulator